MKHAQNATQTASPDQALPPVPQRPAVPSVTREQLQLSREIATQQAPPRR